MIPLDIQLWLLSQNRWVPAAEICARFEIEERALRARDGKPGLLDAFAVSSMEGYIHVRHLDRKSFLKAALRVLRHAFAEMRKVRQWRTARRNQLTGDRRDLSEKFTGQKLLFP